MFRFIAATFLLFVSSSAAALAQADAPTDRAASPLVMASARLIPLLKGEIKPEDYFADSFLAAVPAAQFKALTAQLVAEHGRPISKTKTSQRSPNDATYRVEFEKAFAIVNLSVEPATGKVTGLFLSNIEKRGDSAEKIDAEFAALPGTAGYAVMLLSDDKAPQKKAGRNISQQFAIGSTFKLYILAELAGQIEAGKRKWSDVAPLAHRSFSSQATRNWPENSPATLDTLALQMISVSDNSATDTLLHLLGRENVERRLRSIGHSAPDKTLPFLSTVEAFVLKGDKQLSERYLAAGEAGQSALLKREAAKLTYKDIDAYVFSSPTPKQIDTLEWFASPADIAALLDTIRNSRNDRMLKIMSVNAGPAESRRTDWNYAGYKGGSEPGVVSMSFLGQAKDGKWYAVTGSWNDTEKPVDEGKFSSLMTRLLDSVSGFVE